MAPTIHSPLAILFAKIKAELLANGTPFVDAEDEIAFRTWLQVAWLDSGCTQDFVCLYQPSSSTSIAGVLVAGVGKAGIWWGDGATDSITFSGESQQTINHTYSVAALRPVVVVGKLTRLSFEDQALSGRSSANLRSLRYLDTYGSAGARDLVNGLPPSLEFIYSTTLSGSVDLFPVGMLGIYSPSSLLNGDVAKVPSGVLFLNLAGSLTYTTRQWSNGIRYITLVPSVVGIFTSAMTDSILDDLSLVTFTGEKEVRLLGECGAPTAAADNAIDLLLAQGVNVLTN